MKKRAFSIVFAVVLSSCATLPPQYEDAPQGYELNPKAAGVKIVEFIPSQDRDMYNEVQMSSCALGANAESASTNIESCENKFRNEAARLGSNLVLVKPESKRVGIDTAVDQLTGKAMTCVNCVDMKGIILMSKTSSKM